MSLALVVVGVLLVFLGGAEPRGLRESGDVVFVGGPRKAIEVPCHRLAAAVETERGVAPPAVVGPAHFDLAGDAFARVVRYTAGVHVHDAADGAGAVQQRAGPLQDLHPVGGERIDRGRVVATGNRCIHGIDAVLHDAYASTAHAVDHGPAGGFAERGGMHAGLARHGLADVRGDFAFEVLAVQGDGGLGKPFAGQRVGEDFQGFNGRIVSGG